MFISHKSAEFLRVKLDIYIYIYKFLVQENFNLTINTGIKFIDRLKYEKANCWDPFRWARFQQNIPESFKRLEY